MSEHGTEVNILDQPPGIFLEAAKPSLEQIRRDREKTSGKVRQMLEVLEGVLFEPGLSVQTWKKACGIGNNSVATYFHDALGVPPRTYIERLRLDVAASLLRESNLRIWYIAELLGYSSLGVFSKAFARCVGVRPRSYRLKEWSEAQPLFATSYHERESALAGDLDPKRAAQLVAAILQRYPNLDLASIEEASRESMTGSPTTEGDPSTTNPEAADEPPRESAP